MKGARRPFGLTLPWGEVSGKKNSSTAHKTVGVGDLNMTRRRERLEREWGALLDEGRDAPGGTEGKENSISGLERCLIDG